MKTHPLALITGAAHRVGRSLALTLAHKGYAILLHYNQAGEQAIKTSEEIRSLGVPVFLFQADLTKDTDLISLISKIDSISHPLNVLVNSAAIMRKSNTRDISITTWDTTLALNLRAPYFLSQQAASRMNFGGLIVNITDVGAHKLWTGYPAYVVSKAALETLTLLLAKLYAPGIRVNAIAPGLVLPSDNFSQNEWERLVDRLPLQRPSSMSDISATLSFLVDNPSITGQTIVVDGGYSLI
jgi:pteridine reductase